MPLDAGQPPEAAAAASYALPLFSRHFLLRHFATPFHFHWITLPMRFIAMIISALMLR